MSRYKVTFGFNLAGIGASETYISGDVPGSTMATVRANISSRLNALIQARNNILPDEVTWVGVRLGLADSKRSGKLFRPETYTEDGSGYSFTVPPVGGLVTAANPGRSPDQGRSCIQVSLMFDDNRYANRYLAFPPDSVVQAEPQTLDLTKSPTFRDNFGAWQTVIAGGLWYVKARSRADAFAPLNIASWSIASATPAVLGALVPVPPTGGFKVGEFVTISGVTRKGTDRLSYNGKYRISSLNATGSSGPVTVYLEGTEGALPSTIKNPGIIQRIGSEYFPIQRYYPSKATTHKRGGPFASPRGRRSTRKSLAT